MTERTAAGVTAKHDDSMHDDSKLDGRYGKIGIPAVAAAVAYQSDAKNQAYAPVEPDAERWLAAREAAA
jgi:hypothetical protein